MPIVRWSEAESPLEWATMPHSVYGVSASYRGAEWASVSGNPLHVPGLAPLTGFSRSSDPDLLSGSVKSRNRHFGGCPSLGLAANVSWTLMRAPVDLSRRLCLDQEQPEVSPHCIQMEQVPAGMVGAPQYWQGATSMTMVAMVARDPSGGSGWVDWSVIG